MFRHNLKSTIRSLAKNRTYAMINILGLAISICAFILITLYARHELGYDSFHKYKDNIYRVQLDRYDAGELSTQWAAGCAGIGPALIEEFPEVEMYVKMHDASAVISYEEKIFKEEKIFYSTPDFFKLFTFRLLRGVDSLVLRDPFTALVSVSTARKYFGDEDPIGKVIRHNGRTDFRVEGVFDDIPENSHFEADILYSFETYVEFTNEHARTTWSWDGFLTYILLAPGTDYKEFEKRLPEFVLRKWGEQMAELNTKMVFNLQPIGDIHLYSDYMYEVKINGNGRTTYFLLVIAFFILLIAWVNYVNLSTAKSMERAREVGIRKVLGSMKNQLTRQFLVESYLLNFVAIVLAVGLAILLLPQFNNLAGTALSLSLDDNMFWLTILGLFVIGGLISGFYPALVLSGFKPHLILKGNFGSTSSGSSVRKGLVVFQFIASMVLMVGTTVVFEQLRYMRNQDLGVDIEQTLVLKGPNVRDSLYADQFDAFKQTAGSYAGVSSVASSSSVPGRQPGMSAGGIRLIEETPAESKQYRVITIDGDFIDAYDLELNTGRKFDKNRVSEPGNILFNEAGIRQLGLAPEESLNRDIYFWGDTFNIVGVLKNFHQESPEKMVEPLLFRYNNSATQYYSVKLQTRNIPEILNSLENEYRIMFPGNPFEYFFLDEYFHEQYHAQMRFGNVFGIFAGLAIFIACLGLFGLASYITKYRTKEIGIRKVLGASLSGILLLLSRDFTRLILLAIFIAIPVSWYLMNQWLQDFASRISISWWLFAIPAVILMGIALGSVSFQTARSALTNPVNSLRNE